MRVFEVVTKNRGHHCMQTHAARGVTDDMTGGWRNIKSSIIISPCVVYLLYIVLYKYITIRGIKMENL